MCSTEMHRRKLNKLRPPTQRVREVLLWDVTMRRRGRNNPISSKREPERQPLSRAARQQQREEPAAAHYTSSALRHKSSSIVRPRLWFWGHVPCRLELGNSAAALITQDPATPVQDEGKKRDRGPPADSRDGDQVGVLVQSDGVPPAFTSAWCVMQSSGVGMLGNHTSDL